MLSGHAVLYKALKERASFEHTTVFLLASQHGVKARCYKGMGLFVVSCMFSYPRNKYVATSSNYTENKGWRLNPLDFKVVKQIDYMFWFALTHSKSCVGSFLSESS